MTINQNSLTISELLNYATVRIECKNRKGEVSTGTGFFFKFKEQPEGFIPGIITNKHVIKDSISCKMYLTPTDEKGMPIDGVIKSVTFENEFETFESRWKLHPDDDVDLCAMGFTDVDYQFRKTFNCDPFITYLNVRQIPNSSNLKNISAVEDAYMVGYPNGLWDSTNNKPIFRKGITATNFKFDYRGKKEFLVDMACFPGSSGSPVVLLKEGQALSSTAQSISSSSQFMLLGILYAGPQYTVTGRIEVVDIPVAKLPVPISTIPINLGIVIKSERILELEKLIG